MNKQKLTKGEISTIKTLLVDGKSELTIQEYCKKELGKKVALARIIEIKSKVSVVPKTKDVIYVRKTNDMPKEAKSSSKLTKNQLEQLKEEGFFNIKEFQAKFERFIGNSLGSICFAFLAFICTYISIHLEKTIESVNFFIVIGFLLLVVLMLFFSVMSVILFLTAIGKGINFEE